MLKKKIIVSLLLSATAVALAAGGVSHLKVKAQETSVDNVLVNMQNEYKVGTEIAIPDAYFFEGNNQIATEKTVIYPDGTQYRVSKFIPSTMGEYTVQYSAIVNGELVEQTKSIYVYSDLYSVSGSESKVYYGTNALTPNTNGLNVGLKSCQTFTYNEVIDLNTLGNNPFIMMYLAPERVQEYEATDFYITLTDAYDASNYVNIRVRNIPDSVGYKEYTSYLSAGASFQSMVGYQGIKNTIHRDTNYGFDQPFTFYGCNAAGEPSEAGITSTGKNGQLQLFFDVAEKKIKTQGNMGGFNEITDLDDPKYYSELWSGFTTGKVFLSITTSSVREGKERFNFVVTKIGEDDLTQNKLVDNEKPYINLDMLGYSELPHAIVGKPYSIISANGQDAYGHLRSSDVSVYRNYGSPSQTDVNVEDGKFIPTQVGKYFIVYTATDYSGNTEELVIPVVCDAIGNAIQLDVETTNRKTAANVGEYVKVAAATSTGGNGDTSLKIVVTDASNNPVELVGGAFIPKTAGTYNVTYTAKDFIGIEKSESYTVNVTLSNDPVFYGEEPALEKYYISGYEYVLPEFKAYTYQNGKQEVPVTVKITDDNGERALGADRKANFVVRNAGETKTFTVKYQAGTTVKEFTVTALNVRRILDGNQRLDPSKYFYSSNVSATLGAEATTLTATEDGSVEFINPLLASAFAAEFSFVKTSNLGSFKLILTDSKNANEKVEFVLSSTAGGTGCSVNGQSEVLIPVSYANGAIILSYDVVSKQFTLGESVVAANGFKGFTSGKIILSMEFENVEGESAVAFGRINAQNLTSGIVLDKVAPRIALTKEYDTQLKSIGDVATVHAALAADVFDPNVKITVTVLGPDNKPVKGINGETLSNIDGTKDYQFKLEQNGTYSIRYKAVDAGGNEIAPSRFLKILDLEAPVITLNRENIKTAKLGSVVVVAPITVSDNKTAVENIYSVCFVVRPCGTMIKIDLKDSNSFVANEVGTYVIRYMAMDADTNLSIVESTLTVTE